MRIAADLFEPKTQNQSIKEGPTTGPATTTITTKTAAVHCLSNNQIDLLLMALLNFFTFYYFML